MYVREQGSSKFRALFNSVKIFYSKAVFKVLPFYVLTYAFHKGPLQALQQ